MKELFPLMEELFSEDTPEEGSPTTRPPTVNGRDGNGHRQNGPTGDDRREEGRPSGAFQRRKENLEAAPAPLQEAARGQTVLLTGAGGTIGEALARRLCRLPLQRLLLLDTSEHGLVRLKDQIDRQDLPSAGPDLQVDYLLKDLRRASDRKQSLRENPSIVIHAAAYKHVPFLESRPIVAAENNLLATVDWLRACGHARPVEKFVFVSTDKAIRPSSVMGETKAGAEKALRLFRGQIRQDETEPGSGPRMKATTVRLCNVFGSRGSVVPRFWRRLQEGRPLPVTHPEMKRRFISPNGAAEAILQALRHEAGTYVPTAGRELNIYQLALRMVKWALGDEKAEESDPTSWIRCTGRRRGERLHERLLAPEESPGTDMGDGLCRVGQRPPGRAWKELLQRLDTLRSACLAGEKEEARVQLRQIVRAAAESEKPAA